MPISLQHEQGTLYRLGLSGLLYKTDLDRSQQQLASELDRIPGGKVRLLIVLDGFRGWDPQSQWSDLTFYAKRGDQIERIAIVGDPRWKDHLLMFAVAGLRRAPVEFFPTEGLDEARAWLLG